MSSKPVEITECVDLSEWKSDGKSRVDREAGVIREVKALGWKSLNGREYVPAGVNVAHYEGRVVYSDHSRRGEQRSVRDAIGILEGAEKRDSGIYAQRLRLFNPKGEFEQRVMTAAEVAPHVFGLSHTAKGRTRPGGRGEVVEEVMSVQSVDLVGDPATVTGLYESRGAGMKTLTVKEIQQALKAKRPDYARALTEMAEAGIMGPDMPMPEPADEPAAGAGADHRQAIKDACKACLDDDSLDLKTMVNKIKKLMKLAMDEEGGVEDDGGDADESDSESEAESEESVKKTKEGVEVSAKLARLAKLEVMDKVRTAADEAGVKVPKSLLESVRHDVTDAEVKALVADLKAAGGHVGGQKPRSATPVVITERKKAVAESKADKAGVPDVADPKAVAKWLNGSGK
jgi:hypothetical protein